MTSKYFRLGSAGSNIFPASAQLKSDSVLAQTFFGWTFAASAVAPRSTLDLWKSCLLLSECVKCLGIQGTLDPPDATITAPALQAVSFSPLHVSEPSYIDGNNISIY